VELVVAVELVAAELAAQQRAAAFQA